MHVQSLICLSANLYHRILCMIFLKKSNEKLLSLFCFLYLQAYYIKPWGYNEINRNCNLFRADFIGNAFQSIASEYWWNIYMSFLIIILFLNAIMERMGVIRIYPLRLKLYNFLYILLHSQECFLHVWKDIVDIHWIIGLNWTLSPSVKTQPN